MKICKVFVNVKPTDGTMQEQHQCLSSKIDQLSSASIDSKRILTTPLLTNSEQVH